VKSRTINLIKPFQGFVFAYFSVS